jgi:long-subunit fatty acid transport protein
MSAKLRAWQVISIAAMVWLPSLANASFIETTMGTAVVNDVTASYFNPAALILVKNPQIIAQGTTANFRTHFRGQSTTLLTGVTEVGHSSSNTRYYSPSLYIGIPATQRVVVGIAMVTNEANRDPGEHSILRYVQGRNQIQDYDIVPAVALRLNEYITIGAGINFSYANFQLQSLSGFPGSNLADSQSENNSEGRGLGANAGFLIQPIEGTVIGFNYRTINTYHLSGKSIYEGVPRVVSNHYHYKRSTPARAVISINHFFTKKFGLIGTIQRTQWSASRETHIYGIAGVAGGLPVIINATVPYYLRDTWLLTLGSHYRLTPQWILRVAGTYNQSPINANYQIATGDSFSIAASTGYQVNKTVTIDGSYAHVFVKDANINMQGSRYLINGVNEGSRNSISLRITLNL